MHPSQRIALDFYARINVPECSDKLTIKASYRKLALQHHPDRGGSTVLMQRINEAYDVLMKNKEAYDELLRRIKNPPVMVFEFSFGNDWGNFHGWTQTQGKATTATGF